MNSQRTEQTIDELPGEERGMPSVNETKPSSAARGLIVIMFILVVCAAGGVAYWKYQKYMDKQQKSTTKQELQITSAVPTRTFEAPATEPPSPPIDAIAVQSGAMAGGSAPALPGNAGMATAANGMPLQTLDKSSSSLMVNSTDNTKSANAANTNGKTNNSTGDANQQNQQGSGNMSALLLSTSTPPRSAGMLGNRNFILAKGSFIDCVLQTRLDSTVPGMASCVVTRDIFSDNGKMKLIERGSTATGEYNSTMLKQGMARIFVLWSRIKTPNGVVIYLDSPGTDQLGGAGLPGYIDTHFYERFGSAVMLTLVDDLARYASQFNGSSNGNNQFNLNNSGSSPAQNMATEALKNTINIPPTLYKNQGELVSIYVARDLDFSSVYDVSISNQ